MFVIYFRKTHIFFTEIDINVNDLENPDPIPLFCNLMNLTNQHHLEKLGKFIHHAFKKRQNMLSDIDFIE